MLNKSKINIMYITVYQLVIISLCLHFGSNAQDLAKTSILDISDEALARPLIYLLKDKEDSITAIKEKKRRKQYFGIKTRKAYYVVRKGKKETVYIFHRLKTVINPPIPYVMKHYWYTKRPREIHDEGYSPGKGYLLHGPYKKEVNGKLVEQGGFFKGVKHGRWVQYDMEGHLIRKDKYFRGWPKESLVTFYDTEQKKLKALIPIKHGRKDGDYYLFHDNGKVAVNGVYSSGEKIGLWKSYDSETGKKIREIRYQKKAFENEAGVINKEWSSNGKMIYSLRKSKSR